MFSKYSLSLIVAGLFVFSFIAFSSPERAYAGLGLGCCINNGGNCNPGCGSQGDSCFRDGSGGISPCPTIKTGDCGGIDAPTENKGCFVEGDICFQVLSNTGECQEASPSPSPTPTATPTGTPSPTPDPDCTEDADCTTEDICFDGFCADGFCAFIFDESNAPECVETVGVTIIPTMGQWGMIIATVLLGFFAVLRIFRNRKDSEI